MFASFEAPQRATANTLETSIGSYMDPERDVYVRSASAPPWASKAARTSAGTIAPTFSLWQRQLPIGTLEHARIGVDGEEGLMCFGV